MNVEMIEGKLKVFKIFQDLNSKAHLGGSVGLFLHGIDLKRDLTKSDLDITTNVKILDNDIIFNKDIEPITSSPTDFDYVLRYNFSGYVYLKIEVRVSPEPSFTVINYKGVDYNVSLLKNIIFWKTKYAEKDVQKHIDDLIVINGGERPVVTESNYLDEDDLPF